MKNKLWQGFLAVLPRAIILGVSAALMYMATALLHEPAYAPYYGILYVLVVFLKEVQQA